MCLGRFYVYIEYMSSNMFDYIDYIICILVIGFLYLFLPLVYTILVFISDNNHLPFIIQHLITGFLIYVICCFNFDAEDSVFSNSIRFLVCFPIFLLLFIWYMKLRHGYVCSW